MFKCDRCGECCRNLDKSPLYDELHDGDGICRYLRKNVCTIYEKRPLICRVDDCYDIYFNDKMGYEEYLRLNYKICKELKKIRRD